MVGFLISALVVFGVVTAATTYGEVTLAWLRPLLRRCPSFAVVLAAGGAGLALLFVADEAIRWLETSYGFRTFLGAIFGIMAGFLVRSWRRAEREGGGADAPRWARASGLIPLALTALFVFAVIAPHGEFDLGFLRSVKTPFVEAQFNRNETEHRLEIESEPEGFYTLGRTGLGEVLYLTWADLYFWDAIVAKNRGLFDARTAAGKDARTAAGKQRDAAIALEFALKVLQPIASCLRQGDALLGDQKIATDVLGRIGHRLARALILAREVERLGVTDDMTEATREAREAERKRHLDAAVKQLNGLDGILGGEVAPLMPVLEATARPGAAYEHNLCDRTDVRWGHPDHSIEETDHRILHKALRLPATIHAASMFFLWSGNPRAAATLLKLTPRSSGGVGYPGTDFTLGLTTRWTEAKNPRPSGYLDRWQSSIDILEARIAALELAYPNVLKFCRNRMAERVVLRSVYTPTEMPETGDHVALATPLHVGDGRGGGEGDDTWERLNLSLTPAGQLCRTGEHDDALPCKVRLAYGYYRHYLHKLRNHLVFETARELMTGRDMIDNKDLLERRARVHAEKLEAFVDADGYRFGNCETRIATRVAAGGNRVEAVTQTDAEVQYAVNLDSVGLLTLASAVRDDDRAGIERALGLFERALERGQNFGDDIRLVVRDHRRQARNLLGLQE